MYKLICLFLALLLSPTALHAEKIQIVTEEAYPMNYTANGEIVGYATDYLQTVLADSGFQYDIKLVPWNRAYKMALEDKNTLIYSIARTPDREDKFHWLLRIKTVQYYLYGLTTKAQEFKSLDACTESKIAIVSGDVTHDYLSSLGCGELVLAQDYQQLNSLLTRGRVDFIASSALGIKYFTERYDHNADSFYQFKTLKGLATALYYAINIDTDSKVVDNLRAHFNKHRDHPSFYALQAM